MGNYFSRLILLVTVAWLSTASAAPLIIDHTSVGKYADLSPEQIDSIKKMWLNIPGQSHSGGFRVGCQLLQNLDSRFQANVTDSGPPEGFTTNHLRVSRAMRNEYSNWDYGSDEQHWYTSSNALIRVKRHLAYCNTNGLPISAISFGWSWTPSWHNLPGGATDSVFHVQWAGSSAGGPDGDLRWGLDADDFSITGNRVSMDTYLEANEEYRNYCNSNGFSTRIFFMTAPVDYYQDAAYQAYIKNNHIRNYVSNTTDAILFDYADIVCWDDAGNRKTNAWTDLAGNSKFYEWVADDNYKNLDGSYGGGSSYHLGERGALRLGKALWYMLAQMSAVTNPPANPVLHVQAIDSGLIQMQFVASSNVSYTAEFSPDMSNASWQTLTNFPSQPVEQTNQFTDSTTSIESQRFYRIKIQ